MIPDRVLMYASPLSYAGKNVRMVWAGYKPDEAVLKGLMGLGGLGNDTLIKIQGFLAYSEHDQREFLDRKETLKSLLKILFNIVENCKSNVQLVQFALLMINGIFEDKRSRIRELVALQKSANEA